MTVTFLNVCAKGVSQRVSFAGENVSLEKAFSAVKKQTGFVFFYNEQVMKDTKPVTINVDRMPLEEFLKTLLEGQPVKFVVKSKSISISRKDALNREEVPKLILDVPPVSGIIRDADGKPLAGATVKIKGKNISAVTDEQGRFEISAESGARIIISYIGFQEKEITINNNEPVNISLLRLNRYLDTTEIIVNTGYQKLPKERATGSFENVDNKLFNRSVSRNIMSRLEYVVPGLVQDTRNGGGRYLIRGRSTIFSDSDPLIVVDNFPYAGRLEDFNPNDVESVSVLKDAAAASIWGVRAANGVIVITTKKGRYNQKNSVEARYNMSISDKPDLFYLPRVSVAEHIDFEKMFFDMGLYTAYETSFTQTALTPVQEKLIIKRDNPALAAQMDAEIEELKKCDVRNQFNQYISRKRINEQYSINMSGGGNLYNYFLFVGYDKYHGGTKGNNDGKFSIRTKNSFIPFKNFEADVELAYIQSKASGALAVDVNNLYPYARLADEQGNHLNINKYRDSFENKAVENGLLNWRYSPLDEIDLAQQKSVSSNIRIVPSLKYTIVPGLSVTATYQFQKESINNEEFNSIESYYTRNLVNIYSQGSGSTLVRPIPAQGIMRRSNNEVNAYNFRGAINYNKNFGPSAVSVVTGFEVSQNKKTGGGHTIYGYQPTSASINTNLDYSTVYLLLPVWQTAQIPGPIETQMATTDRFRSYFINAGYTYNSRYMISASARTDASNFFGVKANQRVVPLWSVGAGWNISNENFFSIDWLSSLTLRATYGYNGNINKSVTAYTTAAYLGRASFLTGLNPARIINPSNDALRWEKVAITNLSVEFAALSNRLSGKIEYYSKKGLDLFGKMPLDPTTGVTGASGLSFIQGNSANIKAHGLEIKLSANLLNEPLNWTTDFGFTFNRDKITRYFAADKVASAYLSLYGSLNGVEGRPILGIYSYKWAGLDPQTGNPQGYLDGKTSTDYPALINDSVKNLVYNGPPIEPYLVTLRNTFSYKGFSISANISLKMGHYFRRSSVDYYQTISGNNIHSDITRRWMKSGDEVITNVPSMPVAQDFTNTSRDAFYNFAEILVEKADHIRLQDVRLSYDLNKVSFRKIHINALEIYCLVNNCGIIWRANKLGIDPEVGTYFNLPNPTTYSFGAKLTF